jgi:hypothetical protein
MTKEHYAFAPTPEEAKAYQQGYQAGLKENDQDVTLLTEEIARLRKDLDAVLDAVCVMSDDEVHINFEKLKAFTDAQKLLTGEATPGKQLKALLHNETAMLEIAQQATQDQRDSLTTNPDTPTT